MAKDIYDNDYYKKFHEQLLPLLKGPNIKEVDLKWLEPRVKEYAQKTKHGSHVWRSVQSSRLAAKTVYLGSERVRLPYLLPYQEKVVKGAPDELEKVLKWMKTLPFIKLTR